MVRGIFIKRSPAERMAAALDRYLKDISPTKKVSTQSRETRRIRLIKDAFGKYSLAAVTPDLIANYRDQRLAAGKSNNTVRLELALLGPLYSVAIREWQIGLLYNPVANIRKPKPGEGRNRRLTADEETRLLAAADTWWR